MLTRKVVLFKPTEDIELDYNYNYQVTRNIYHYLWVADRVKSRFIHDVGYEVVTGHKFKLFNFTILFKDAIFNEDHILCTEDTIIKLIISGKESIVQSILKGILQVRKIKLYDYEIPLLKFEDDIGLVRFEDVMLYKALSPIVETTKNEQGNVETLTPYHGEYYRNLAINAKRKYKLIHSRDYEGNIFFDIDNALNIKDKYISFKGGVIRGFLFNIWVEAEMDMQQILYYLGLGQNSSTGFGCLSTISRRR